MEKLVCIICNKKLRWGGFAYNQEMCIDCFQTMVKDILHNIDEFYPSWLWYKIQIDTDMIMHMFNVMAESYGYSNRIKQVSICDK